MNSRSLGLLPETHFTPLGSSPRQNNFPDNKHFPRSSVTAPTSRPNGPLFSANHGGSYGSSGSGSTVHQVSPVPDASSSHKQYTRPTDYMLLAANVDSRRVSSEYTSQGYEGSYTVHSTPSNDYFSYRNQNIVRPTAESSHRSPEQLNRVPLYNSVTSSDSLHNQGVTPPPPLESPEASTRPRPSSFSHDSLSSVGHTGIKPQVPGMVPVNAYAHAPMAGTSPHGLFSNMSYAIVSPQYAGAQSTGPINEQSYGQMHTKGLVNTQMQTSNPLNAPVHPSGPGQTFVHSGNVPFATASQPGSMALYSGNMTLHSGMHLPPSKPLHPGNTSSHVHGAAFPLAYARPDIHAFSHDQNNALVNKRRVTKRRTRSGCMTCRKRRIKCDERKPHCFNCERSKKLCLGYELVPANSRRAQDPEVLKPKGRLLVQSLM